MEESQRVAEFVGSNVGLRSYSISTSNYIVLSMCLNYQLEKLKTEDKLLLDYPTAYHTSAPLLREWGF